MEIVFKTDPNHGRACKGTCEATQDIERALDEAEKRGARGMRERAAALYDEGSLTNIRIRALPIEGE